MRVSRAFLVIVGLFVMTLVVSNIVAMKIVEDRGDARHVRCGRRTQASRGGIDVYDVDTDFNPFRLRRA